MMVSADEVPICFAGHDALDLPWVVLASGLTGPPSLLITPARPDRHVGAGGSGAGGSDIAQFQQLARIGASSG